MSVGTLERVKQAMTLGSHTALWLDLLRFALKRGNFSCARTVGGCGCHCCLLSLCPQCRPKSKQPAELGLAAGEGGLHEHQFQIRINKNVLSAEASK